MPLTIIVGGQYGSEGKGKVAYHFAKQSNADIAIKVGGPNSGHTVYKDGEKYVFKTLPTPSLDNSIISVIPSGAYFTLENLYKELEMSGIDEEHLVIDPYCAIISDEQIKFELNSELIDSISSTGSGMGACISDRVMRNKKISFAGDYPEFSSFIKDSKKYLRDAISNNMNIIVEGTQGFGLSLLHSNEYPFVTSRDTTAASVLSEIGLSPFDVTDIILTIRAFPIRVGGNSGKLNKEVSWDFITENSGSNVPISEYTSVTNKLRRVAEFSEDVVIEAIRVNKPSIVVMNHLDYVDYSIHDADQISDEVEKFLLKIEKKIGLKVDYCGVDPYKLIKR